MISFEGRFKSKRQPPFANAKDNYRDPSGPIRETSSQEFIRLKQEDRRRRERQSREMKAIIRIQSLARGAISRRQTADFARRVFNQLSIQLMTSGSSLVTNKEANRLWIRDFSSCLRAFKFIGETRQTTHEVIAVSKLMLSPTGQAAYYHWLDSSKDTAYPIVNTVSFVIGRLLFHLSQLETRTGSRAYLQPVRVLEVYVGGEDQCLSENRKALITALCDRGYYHRVTAFIGRQCIIAPMEEADETSREDEYEYDLDEFCKQPKNKALLNLLHLPLQQGRQSDHILSVALADISALSFSSAALSHRSQLILGYFLRALPSELIISQMNIAASSGSKGIFLKPSVSLLHHFICQIVPTLLNAIAASQLPPVVDSNMENGELKIWPTDAMHQGSQQEEQKEAKEEDLVLKCLRILAWFFSALIQYRCGSQSDVFAPPFLPAPLQLRGEINGHDSDSEMDSETAQESSDGSGFLDNFANVWPTQMAEVFASLQKYLPSLALIALKIAYSSSNTTESFRKKVTLDITTLHYMIAFVRSSSANSMIPLNSVLSQFPGFLRDLWDMTLSFEDHEIGELRNDLDKEDSLSMTWRSRVKFFDLLASGEVKTLPPRIEMYTAIVLTLVDCLRHRLLCLTDVEISNEEDPDGAAGLVGFSGPELMVVGQRLRDLMLGLIGLAYPGRRPDCHILRARIQVKQRNNDVASLHEALERVQQKTETKIVGARPTINSGHFLGRNSEEARILRWELHRWSTLFCHTQCLVALIYDWDRRHARSIDMRRVGEVRFDASASSTSPWLKPACLSAFQLDRLPRWLSQAGRVGAVALAQAPFAYYSLLNPDGDDETTMVMSYWDWRQMTTLMEMPFVITFWQRVQIFQALVKADRHSVQHSQIPSLENPFAQAIGVDPMASVQLRVRRGYLYEDAFENLSKENAPSLKPRLKVTFFNQANMEEMGLDGGGLSREFLTQSLTEGFNPTRGWFLYTDDDNTLYPNPNAENVAEDYLKHYYFLGRLLAKAIYEGMLVELRFAHFFLAKLISRTGGGVGFDYLHSLDKELYRQLCKLKNYPGNVADLELDFTTMQANFGQQRLVELKPNGAAFPVTEANKVEYIHLVANYKLNRQIYRQSKAFIAGMTDVVHLEWLRLFDAEELQILISGADTTIDIADLRANTLVFGDTSLPENKQTLEYFWILLSTYSENQKRQLLRFATACSRPPMFGFSDLQPPFSIQLVPDIDRLPTSSTCMNLLKLPAYADLATLRAKLDYALGSGAGFEYS